MVEGIGQEGDLPMVDPLNPVYLNMYLTNFSKIMKRQMPNVSDETLYQDAFNQMIDLLLPDDKKTDLDYLNQIIEVAKTLEPPITLTIPTNVASEAQRAEVTREEKAQEEQRESQEKREGKPLEEQLAEAISEERYEDAGEIQKKIDKMKTLLGGKYTDNLHKGEIREGHS